MKKIISVAIFIAGLAAPKLMAAATRYVQISTNAVAQQTGSFNVAFGTMSGVSFQGVVKSSTDAGTSGMVFTSSGPLKVPVWSFAGKVLQFQSFTVNTGSSTTSTSFVTTTLSGTVTPSTSTSKMLIVAQGTISHSASGFAGMATLANGTSPLGPNSNGSCEIAITATGYAASIVPCLMIASESPGTVSPQTYNVRIKTMSGTGTTTWSSGNDSGSTLWVIELGQ